MTALWVKERPLARKIASRFNFPGADQDDVVQEAMIALWEAAQSFDPGKGTFQAFASRVIEQHLGDCLKASLCRKRQVLTKTERVFSLDGETTEILEILPHLHQVSDRVEEREDIERLLRAIRDELTPFQRHCVLGIASGLSYLEIGDPRKVDKHAYKARVKLREVMCRS